MTDDEPKSNDLNALSPQAAKAAAATISEEVTAQPSLFALPDLVKPADASVASSQQGQKRKRQVGIAKADARSDPADLGPTHVTNEIAIAPGKSQIVYVDPFKIVPEAFNGRGLAPFDPIANRDLIEDMRVRGNTVPVALRPKADNTGWTCPSGSRRVNSAKIIAVDDPEFRVAAIIYEAMTDAQAYALCLADNHGRSEVTAMQRGREIRWALANLYNGDRSAYCRNHRVDTSVVTRALDLVGLPEPILACAVDREALPTLFAEKLAPRLKEKAERKVILDRAKALGDDRLEAPRLLSYLLTGERETPPRDRRMAFYGSGRDRVRASVTVAPNGSALIKVPATLKLDAVQRAEMALFLKEQVDGLILG